MKAKSFYKQDKIIEGNIPWASRTFAKVFFNFAIAKYYTTKTSRYRTLET